MIAEPQVEPERQVYPVRGAAGTLVGWVQDSRLRASEGMSNGGVPKEVCLAGPAGTGKSFAIALMLFWVATNHQGCRILIVRKTRASLTESVCTTIEKILGPGHPYLAGASKENRHGYKVGDSEIVLGSMENPDRLYSTEWDIVWIEEAREIKRGPYLKFMRSLRNFKLPFQLLLSSTNPDAPTNHLYQRWGKGQGKLVMLKSEHKDNPAYWDQVNERWTPWGVSFMDALDRLEGNDRLRLKDGLWVAAEGSVFPEYDPEIHDVTLARDEDGWVTKAALAEIDNRAFYAGIDFGWDAPGAIGIWAYCGNRHLYLIAQVEYTGQQPEWWADALVELNEHYPLELAFCDPSRPDAIALLNDKLGVSRDEPGAIAIKADNDWFSGSSIVRSRISKDKPTIFFDKNSCWAPLGMPNTDEKLDAKSVPSRLEEEIPGYIYKRQGLEDDGEDGVRKDEPVKKDDHACFVAGTLVETVYGPRPIESIRVGDRVLTPFGPRAVLDVRMTNHSATIWQLTTMSGRVLRGTGDHPIWTSNGPIRLDALGYGDKLAAWQPLKQSSGVGSPGVVTRKTRANRIASTTGASIARTESSVTRGYTKRFTERTLARSSAGCAFTTRTVTPAITGRETSNCSRRERTRLNTQAISRKLNLLRVRGIQAQLVLHGIENTHKRLDLVTSTSGSANALSAAMTFSCERSSRSSAGTTARRPTAAEVASMTKRVSVLSAESHSVATITLGSSVALDHVAHVHVESQCQPVYNLTVDVDHVYFAGGVLVFNCDAMRYVCKGLHYYEPQQKNGGKKKPIRPGSMGDLFDHEAFFSRDSVLLADELKREVQLMGVDFS